jgi:hypothetical protein
MKLWHNLSVHWDNDSSYHRSYCPKQINSLVSSVKSIIQRILISSKAILPERTTNIENPIDLSFAKANFKMLLDQRLHSTTDFWYAVQGKIFSKSHDRIVSRSFLSSFPSTIFQSGTAQVHSPMNPHHEVSLLPNQLA